jgi:hypothetical protein
MTTKKKIKVAIYQTPKQHNQNEKQKSKSHGRFLLSKSILK